MFNSNEIRAVKESEIKNRKDNCVYEEVGDQGQKVRSVRWVITDKIKNSSVINKARLVACEFEKDPTNLCKVSLTCSKETTHITLSLASSNQWICHMVDVKSAYLEGGWIK